MKAIPRETIEAVWERQCALDEAGSQALVKRFTEEQPFLTLYLTMLSDVSEDDDENSQLIPLALLVWECFRLQKGTLPQVDDQAIESAEATNEDLLTEMDMSSEIEQAGQTKQLLQNYRQQALMGFILEILMSGNEETPELAPESMGMEFLTLKTVIDCFDK